MLIIWSQWYFAHGMTVVPSSHVEKIVVIRWPDSELKQSEISLKLELWVKNLKWKIITTVDFFRKCSEETHCMINTELAQLFEILLPRGQGPVYPAYSIPWLLMSWWSWHREPGIVYTFFSQNIQITTSGALFLILCSTFIDAVLYSISLHINGFV